MYSAYHTPVAAVKVVAMSGREIPLRKNNGILFTPLSGSKGGPAFFRKEASGGWKGKHFLNAKATEFWGKLWFQKRDSSSVSRPSGDTKPYPGIVLWIPVATLRKTLLFLRGGDTRRKKMLGDTTGILQN